MTIFEMEENSQQITQLLKQWSGGKPGVLNDLMPLVCAELRRQVSVFLRRERSNHTLQPTALINEAYLWLIDQCDVKWQNRAHFFAIAAQAMRPILVDYARERKRETRGGAAGNLPLHEALTIVSQEKNVDLIALDEALNSLAHFDERRAKVVELRYFSGLSVDETVEVLGVSNVTTRGPFWSRAEKHHNYFKIYMLKMKRVPRVSFSLSIPSSFVEARRKKPARKLEAIELNSSIDIFRFFR